MNDPGLSVVQHAMLEIDDIECSFVCNSVQPDQVAILCLTFILLMLETS